MELDMLDKETKVKGNLGYKVFEMLPDGRLAHINHPDLVKSQGIEYRSNSTDMIEVGAFEYKAGFHIFPSKLDAEAYLNSIQVTRQGHTDILCKVHFNRVSALGAVVFDGKPHAVVVTGAITIINIEPKHGYNMPKGWGRLFRPLAKSNK